MEMSREDHLLIIEAWSQGLPIQYRNINEDVWKNWFHPFCPVWDDNLRFRVDTNLPLK
jgi:hypothetical protein